MTTLLLAYDGSDDAMAAIEHAGRLIPGARTTVLTVWEPLMDSLLRSGAVGLGGGYVGDTVVLDDTARTAAATRAEAGAEIAADAGLLSTPLSVIRHGDVPRTILATAAELDAVAIVVGSRGLGGMKSYLLGSVSHSVLQHADRPVVVVPSPALVDQRHRWVTAHTVPVA